MISLRRYYLDKLYKDNTEKLKEGQKRMEKVQKENHETTKENQETTKRIEQMLLGMKKKITALGSESLDGLRADKDAVEKARKKARKKAAVGATPLPAAPAPSPEPPGAGKALGLVRAQPTRAGPR